MAPRKKAAPPPTPGETLVAEILAEMREAGVIPDAKETALLETARQIVDRITELEAIITRDGMTVPGPQGSTRIHPAVAEHRQQAVALPKVLSGIIIGNTAAGATKNPTKQRAAFVRWERVARQKEAQAQAAGL